MALPDEVNLLSEPAAPGDATQVVNQPSTAMVFTTYGLDGRHISFPRALLRSFPLVVVLLFSGWKLPELTTNAWLALMATTITVGLGGSIAYLLLFNRKAGRSLHDLLAGTRVVHDRGH